MMHFDEIGSERSVRSPEIEPTCDAAQAAKVVIPIIPRPFAKCLVPLDCNVLAKTFIPLHVTFAEIEIFLKT